MAENQVSAGGYGYVPENTDPRQAPFSFGLNPAYLTKFEFITNAGENNSEGEALQLEFSINGRPLNTRVYPTTVAYGENNVKIYDTEHPKWKEAEQAVSSQIVHILNAFYTGREDVVKQAFNDGFVASAKRNEKIDFKVFARIATTILPKDYQTVSVDIFLHYQWTIKPKQTITYLEAPSKTNDGKWITASRPYMMKDGQLVDVYASKPSWKEVRVPNPDDKLMDALYYVNEAGPKDEQGVFTERHPFVRNGYYMNRQRANQQKSDAAATGTSTQATTSAAPEQAAQNAAPASKPAW